MGATTTYTSPAAATKLTTAAAVAALPGADSTWTTAQITVAVNAAHEAICRYCDREFVATTYRHWIETDGGHYLRLRQYPLINLYRVALGHRNAIKAANTATGMTWASATITENGTLNLTVVGGASAGTSALTLSSYTSLALLGTAIDALGTGWASTIEYEGDPQCLRPGYYSGQTSGANLYLMLPDSDCVGFVPDTRTGMLHHAAGWPRGDGAVFCHYQAGYSTIPSDLSAVCGSLACDLLYMQTSDPGLTSEKVGNITYQYSTATAGAALEPYKAALTPYRRMT